MKWTIHRLNVTPEKADQRFDQYLADSVIEMSRTQAKKVIDLGGAHINGRRIRSCSTFVRNADFVEIYLDHLPLEPYRITERDILFQDQFIIVLNKPALVETQPTHARYKGTLFEALQWYLKDPFRPHQKADIGMVQRLDRGTSGLIIFSIHPQAHKQMTRIFLEHEIEKGYLALVHGAPKSSQGEIRSFLARSRKGNRVKSVAKGGKEAITRFQIIEPLADYSLLDIKLLTGRSHQIRAHMMEQNCPLLGDHRYGGDCQVAGLKVLRPLLHAVKLAFQHPVSGQDLEFTIPMPEDMQNVINRLRDIAP